MEVDLRKCPNCGGRVSFSRKSDTRTMAACVGTAGEGESCGWSEEIETPDADSRVKRSA